MTADGGGLRHGGRGADVSQALAIRCPAALLVGARPAQGIRTCVRYQRRDLPRLRRYGE